MIHSLTANPGSGGANLGFNVFTDTDSVSKAVGYSQLAFGADASIPTVVTASAGLPVQQQTGATWAVSAASLPLPAGAATSAKQPALGTAGSASADVLTVQGIASMIALKVDGSGVTQPVSGTVTANAGTGTFGVNVAQVAGTATDTNSGNKSAGTQRVVIATDQPQLTNALKVDGSAVTQPVSGTVTSNQGTPAAVGNAWPVKVSDGSNTAALFQTHNADNQTLGGGAFAVNTGGVAQLLNPAGTIDRQRATGFDGAPGAGIPAGSAQFAIPFSTTITQAVTGSGTAQAVTVASSANLKVGDYLSVGGANPEQVFASAVGSGNVTAVFSKNHSNTDPLNWFHYNVARDAGVGDNVSPTGFSASATYLYNAFSGNMELDRSAAGETDNASGRGTAVAAEYEYANTGFDRARNLQGKGLTQATITSTAGSDSTLTFSADPSTAANGGLKAGQYLLLSTGLPTPLTGDWVQVGASYTSGTSVPVTPAGLTAGIAAGRTRASFSSWSLLGPTTAGFIADGVGLEEEAVYDPVSGLYFIERAATQDGVSGQNVVMEAPALLNSSGTFDREYNASGDGVLGTALGDVRTPKDRSLESEVSYLYAWNSGGTGWNRARLDASNNLQVNVNAALPAGTNTLGAVSPAAATSGGATGGRYLAAASTNQDSQNIKGSAGTLYMLVVINVNAAVRYLKIYDKATAPTSADTPLLTIGVPGNTAGAGVAVPVPAVGIAFSNGWGFRMTTGQADNDTGAVTAGDLALSYGYK